MKKILSLALAAAMTLSLLAGWKLNSTVNIRACATVCDYLKKYEDPRLNDFYSPNTDGSGETTALKYGASLL